MKIELTAEQFSALTAADFLPDVLRRCLDNATAAGGKQVLDLDYEEATALQELCAWNVKNDDEGNVTPETKKFDEIVNAVINHPEF